MPVLIIMKALSNYNILLLLTILFVAGCSPTEEISDNTITVCPDIRPEICTQQYQPVCAQTSDSEKTFSNACVACSDASVVGYVADACEN